MGVVLDRLIEAAPGLPLGGLLPTGLVGGQPSQFALEPVPVFDSFGGEHAAVDGGQHGASRLGTVLAIGEPALVNE